MIRSFTLITGLAGSLILADPASACIPPPPEPRLAGESDLSYQARVEKIVRERQEQRSIQRQQSALNATTLFIAREASAEFHQQKAAKWAEAQAEAQKRGEPPLPPVPPPEFPLSRYFQPIAWIKGTGSQAIFRIETSMTTCGYWSPGDTGSAGEGERLLFSAREGPISENTLIDAIAIDKITEPELVELISTHLEHRGTGSEVSKPPRS